MSNSEYKVKICGLTRQEDCGFVNAAMPDYVGFVFAPSRRQIDVHTAMTLKKRLDPKIKTVGVFVNESLGNITALYKSGIIDIIQLHGDEDDDCIDELRESGSTCPIIKSVSIGDALPPLPSKPDFLLFDTLAGTRGGSGMTFDWSILKNYTRKRYFLSGGLICGNVTGALGILNPYCIDVSSGVETDGVKDAKKIEQFVRIVREFGGHNLND